MINLDKPRKLRLTIQAALEIEQTFGIKILDVDNNMESISKILWILLKQEEKEISFEQTCEMMNEAESMSYISNTVLKAIITGMAGEKKKDEKEQESPNAKPPDAKSENS
jgi:hypothetical protein